MMRPDALYMHYDAVTPCVIDALANKLQRNAVQIQMQTLGTDAFACGVILMQARSR